jgi:hypothetical protein
MEKIQEACNDFNQFVQTLLEKEKIEHKDEIDILTLECLRA